MKKSLLLAAACLVSPTLVCSAAFAHAFLDRASPAVGSEVTGSPPAIALTYTEPVEPLFSTVMSPTPMAPGWTKASRPPAMTGGSCRSA